MSEETDIIEKRYPVIKIVIDYSIKRLELLLVAIILTGGISFFSDKNARKAIWQEAGPHLMDAHNEIYNDRISMTELSNRIVKLESQIYGNRTNTTIGTAITNITISEYTR